MAPPANGDRTRDKKRVVWAADGDLFLYDFSVDKARQLTKTAEGESNPQFTQDEKHVAYTRGGNMFVMSLDSGLLVQLTLLSYRYLFLLADELGRLRIALRVRGYRNRVAAHSRAAASPSIPSAARLRSR